MPKLPDKPKPKCIACGDTGKNSKGGFCEPCLQNYAIETSLMEQPVPSIPQVVEALAPEEKAVEL